MKQTLTKQERSWILYDVGNSAFTLLISTIIPIYFNSLAQGAGLSSVTYLAYWGYAASIATLLVAVSGPILGTISDGKGRKKPLFLATILVGAVGCLCLGLAKQWLAFLTIFVVAKIGYSLSLILYDSMLTDITDRDRMDNVSSQGYAWGYIGSCVPFLLCLALVLGSGRSGHLHDHRHAAVLCDCGPVVGHRLPAPAAGLPAAALCTCQKPSPWAPPSPSWASPSGRSARDKTIFLFLIAFFFYIDGVYTIIDMATAYGSALGLDTTGLLLALLVTQIVAFPSAICIGRLARKLSSVSLISLCIVAYFGIAVFAFFLSNILQFWMLAVLVGLFQGGIQALSRSHFAKLIPAAKSGEYFGLLDICGKGASLLGTTVVSLISQATGSANLGVGAIAIFFLIGLAFFRLSARAKSVSRPADAGDPESTLPPMPELYRNRELSWLKFNQRVLEEGAKKTVPLCERLSFVSIYQSNLDEFFMVRVGSLVDQMSLDKTIRDNKTNLTPREQIDAILSQVRQLQRPEGGNLCRPDGPAEKAGGPAGGLPLPDPGGEPPAGGLLHRPDSAPALPGHHRPTPAVPLPAQQGDLCRGSAGAEGGQGKAGHRALRRRSLSPAHRCGRRRPHLHALRGANSPLYSPGLCGLPGEIQVADPGHPQRRHRRRRPL